ncbi:MAG: hypothetical protein DRI83_04130 [Bacteroidetes bacterium]|nr:MAG: hypothetical protein DRI83_04130 [Bacteroidota bacterium]
MKKNYFLVRMMVVMLSFFVLTNVAYSQLYINEFMASNDVSFPGPQGDYPDWIEIYNAGTEAVMLGGYYMSDVLDDTAAMYQIPDTYPDSVTVAAGSYILFYANKGEASSVLNLNFKLSGGGEAVGLWDASSTLIDSYTYGEQTTDISFGRYPDGTDEWGFMSDITPGASNATPDPPATVLFINEFMASNDVSFPGPQGDFPDWIEIYNPGAEAVNLAGYYMADDLGDTAAMYQIPATYPDSVTVEAGGFIVFYANKGEASSVLNLDFKLSGGGEQIGLWNADQIFMDSLTYGEQITDTSYGRYQDGTDNWYFMADITPGASNINPNPPPTIELYINEFMASNDSSFPGPQGDYPDWIEIYNPGTEAVMLGGYFMSDDLVDPAAMYQISDAYPDSVTVEAGGFIVFYANKEEASSVLNLNFKLSGGGEQIGLWNADQIFMDSLTYGEQITDTSYGRFADGTDNWFFMPEITPGATNLNTMSIDEIEDYVSVSQNYPNPFSAVTNIQFTLERPDQVSIKVFDVRGTLITVLADDNYTQGVHTIQWDASAMPAGYYFYTLQTKTGVITKKALIIR